MEQSENTLIRAPKRKPRKPLFVFVSLVAATVMFGVSGVLLSHLIWHRSLAANLYMLQKQATRDHKSYEEEAARLLEVKALPEKAYTLQKHFKFSCDYRIEEEAGMPVHISITWARSSVVR